MELDVNTHGTPAKEVPNGMLSNGMLNRTQGVWEAPAFVEIRMDAEIGSYQDDFDGEDWH